MFKTKVVALIYILVSSAILMAIFLLIPSREDFDQYRTLMEKVDTSQVDKDSPYTAMQRRSGIFKQVVYLHDEQRLQMALDSDTSRLVLDHHDESTEIVEHLNNVHCMMQVGLYYIVEDGREVICKPDGTYALRQNKNIPFNESGFSLAPMQEIRYFEADTAAYYYKTDRFAAKHVRLKQFLVPGHQLVNSVKDLNPVFIGNAETAEFNLTKSDINFEANQFKVSFYDLGGNF